VKKSLMIAVLAVLAAPSLVLAQGQYDSWEPLHKREHKAVRADQLAGIGFGVAALLSVAGYLILRKRNVTA